MTSAGPFESRRHLISTSRQLSVINVQNASPVGAGGGGGGGVDIDGCFALVEGG